MGDTKVSDSRAHWTSTDVMRPTQCTVGYLEVQLKMDELRARGQKPDELVKYLKGHPIPAVLGPDGRMYLTDHHHMGLALVKLANEWDDGENPAARNPYRSCCFQIMKDLSTKSELTMQQFFAMLDEHYLSHPFDALGNRVNHIPKQLTDLADDPYRSLAGLARKAGAYDKVDAPFSEFIWADFFRGKIDSQLICRAHIVEGILQAITVANGPAAAGLPGYHGAKSALELPTLAEISERVSKRHGADDASPDLPAVSARR